MSKCHSRIRRCCYAALIAFAASSANAAPVTWMFDIATTGQDVHWLSPTAADNAAPIYDMDYSITQVIATIRYLFITTDVDVTDQIPPDQLANSGTAAGPPPIVFAVQSFTFPPPPEPLAVAADLTTALNADGHGQLDVTNVELGTYTINLPPFGNVTVTILGVRVAGSVTVTPVYAGDVDRDGDVDLSDLSTFLAAFGACVGDPAFNMDADVNGDGCVSLSDLALLLANFGRS